MVDCLASALAALAVVLFVTPAVLIAAVPLTFGYLRVQNLYIATNRELKRLDSIALSPIFSKFSETLAGLITVRAFRKQGQFAEQNQVLIDQSNRAWWPMQVCCLSLYCYRVSHDYLPRAFTASMLLVCIIAAQCSKLCHAFQMAFIAVVLLQNDS